MAAKTGTRTSKSSTTTRGGASPIPKVARELRAALRAVLAAAGGDEPRPMALSRKLGIDKSLASVLVRAANAPSDATLLQLVPSPSGLGILAERVRGHAPRAKVDRLRQATEQFRAVLAAMPGGRAALDAQLAEGSRDLGRKREHSSRQATFKSSSYLLGYFSDMLCTRLFLVPSADGTMVEGIEMTRRIGVRRMRSTTTIPMFSFVTWPEGPPPKRSTYIEPIAGAPGGPSLENVLVHEYCTKPLPPLELANEQDRTTVLLPGGAPTHGPMDLTWAIRIRNGGPADPGPGSHHLNAYFLHMPTRRLVRDLYIAESVYPGASPFATFAMPGTLAHLHPPDEGTPPYYGHIDLLAELEPVPDSDRMFAVPGLADHAALTRDVLARAGHGETRFRGWRCTINYPLPLIQMIFWLRHPVPRASRARS